LTHVLPPISTSRFAHLCRARPRGSIRSLLPLQLYLDHSVAAATSRRVEPTCISLAALPSTRAIWNSFPSQLTCRYPRAALPSMSLSPKSSIVSRLLPLARPLPHGFAVYVAFPKSSIPSIATCSMSLIPQFHSVPAQADHRQGRDTYRRSRYRLPRRSV